MVEEIRITENGEERITEDGEQRIAVIPGGGSGVASVFGRSGDVVAQFGDYTIALIPGLQGILDGLQQDLSALQQDVSSLQQNVFSLQQDLSSLSLSDLANLDAGGAPIGNYLSAQSSISGDYTFIQSDAGKEMIYTGGGGHTFTIPALSAGTHAVVHNVGIGPIDFAATGVILKGNTTLAVDKTAAVSWLPNNVVKLTGELT